MSVSILYNSQAGSRRARRAARTVAEALHEAGMSSRTADVREPPHPLGDGPVVIAGGDGTVHRTLNALIARDGLDALPPIAICPVGSGNDFAGGAELPHDPADVAARVAAGNARPMDLIEVQARGADGEVTTAYTINAAGCGIEAWVADASNHYRHLGPRLRYIRATLAAARGPLKRWEAEIEWRGPGGVDHRQAGVHSMNVANGPRSGGGLRLLPDARFDDGQLDFLVLSDISRARMGILAMRLVLGLRTAGRGIQRERATALTVRSDCGLPVHADGETLCAAATEASFRIRPGAMTLLA